MGNLPYSSYHFTGVRVYDVDDCLSVAHLTNIRTLIDTFYSNPSNRSLRRHHGSSNRSVHASCCGSSNRCRCFGNWYWFCYPRR
ncbi:hypothetical protein [Moraxella lacunata]|uniref:hypothetical protein n=1 Tax=Moraxella lacunata TaxID=477 RepID=UPI003EE142FB